MAGIFDESALAVWRTGCLGKIGVKESTNFTCKRRLPVHLSLAEFWTDYATDALCQDREKYGQAMECILTATKGCLPEENQRHFPSIDDVRQGLQYICSVSRESSGVNITCAREHFTKVYGCLRKETLTAVRRRTMTIPMEPEHMCRTYDFADLCSWEKLKGVCGELTAGAYLRLMKVYFRPPTCRTSGSAVTSPSLWILLMGLVCTVLGLKP